MNDTKSKKPKIWSDDEINFLKERYTSLGPSKCAELLNISYKKVEYKAKMLNLKKIIWSEEDLSFLEKNYQKMNKIKCAQILNKNVQTVNKKIREIYGKQNLIFSQSEKSFIKENYEKLGAAWCAKHLDKTVKQINSKANKMGLFFGGERGGNKKQALKNIKEMGKNFNVNSEFIAYLLGFVWGDGYIRKSKSKLGRCYCSIEIVYDDSKDLIKILNICNVKYAQYIRNRNDRKKSIVIIINSPDINEFMRQNDFEIKSSVAPYKVLERMPKKFHKNFFHGLSDADGCFYVRIKKTYQYSISGTYEYDWGFLEKYFSDIGIKKYQIKNIEQYGKNRYSIIRLSNKKEIQKLINEIYNSNVTGLLRKREKAKFFFKSSD